MYSIPGFIYVVPGIISSIPRVITLIPSIISAAAQSIWFVRRSVSAKGKKIFVSRQYNYTVRLRRSCAQKSAGENFRHNFSRYPP
jgi:UPF0716 family protein affecting phage T7 exclusion